MEGSGQGIEGGIVNLSVPHPGEGSPSAGDEVAWRRELKQLRVRVTQLEAERGIKQAPSIEVKRSEVHGYQCGAPCGVAVIENTSRVECAVCGTELNAVEVLRDYAKHERNFCYSLEHLRKERRDLAIEVAKLKKLRSRLRSDARKCLPPAAGSNDEKCVREYAANAQLDRVLAGEVVEGDG